MSKQENVEDLFEAEGAEKAVDAVYVAQQLEAYTVGNLLKCSPEDREVFRLLFKEGLLAGMRPGAIGETFAKDVKEANRRFWLSRRTSKSPLASALVQARLVR